RDAEEILGPLRPWERRPAVLERVARDLDRAAHLLGRRLADDGERLLARGGDRLVGLAGLQPFAPDVVAIALVEMDDLARLGRGRVVPARRDERALPLLPLQLSQR